jgi:hypothetical protein
MSSGSIEGRPISIEGFQPLAKISQISALRGIDAAQEMAGRNAPFEVKEIEQLAQIDNLPTHHDLPPSAKTSRRRITIRPSERGTFSTPSAISGSRAFLLAASAIPS